MPATPTISVLDATAAAFAPSQGIHPRPAPNKRFSSPLPSLSAVNFQSQSQFQPQQYFGPQKHYGYQPFPIFNGYTQAYEFPATPTPYSAQPQGAVFWYPQQNGYVGYTVNPHEPFADQFTELQGVRNGHITGQNSWYHSGTGNHTNTCSNDASKKKAKNNKRKKYNRSNKELDRAEEHKVKRPTEAEPSKLGVDVESQEIERQTETETETETEIKVASAIGEQD